MPQLKLICLKLPFHLQYGQRQQGQPRRSHDASVAFGNEALITKSSNKVLAGQEQEKKRLLLDKWQHPYSHVCGYVNAGLSIALIRVTHHCLRGYRVPAPLISVKYAQWERMALASISGLNNSIGVV
eukprot:scaffold63560_cov42-Attheya_sp.AAC.1